MAKYALKDFYGFGDITSKKFENEYNITGDDLIDDWNQYILDNPEKSIIMISQKARPTHISKKSWDILNIEQRQETVKLSLEQDLKHNTRYLHKLNYHQLIGVKHYFNIMKKIPRIEMMTIEKVLTKALKYMNDKLNLTICGSYRRGRFESGDIDCLITHPEITTHNNSSLLNDIICGLTKCNFLIDHLTENGETKYMGLCKVLEIPRRIDIRIIPWESYPFAILYFTGSKNHNKDMRIIAKKKGYKLNEYGLENILDHKLINLTSEEEIFDFLEMKYLNPNERDY